MSIGLYDYDMATYTIVPPNLELMKLAAYYKKQREIVILSPDFTPERHQKFFVRKDYNDGMFTNGLRAPNVTSGGLAFTNNNYIALPEEIELCKPDTSIYQIYEKPILSSGFGHRKQFYLNTLSAEHARISLDGKTIWPNYRKQFKFLPSARNIVLHDYDLGQIDGAFDEVKNLLASARTDGWATRFGTKFPIQISNGNDLLNWASVNPNRIFFGMRYNGVIDPDTFIQYAGVARERTTFSQLEYYCAASSSSENDFVKNHLREIFYQVLISRSFRVRFSLKYDDDFFKEPKWARVIDLFNYFLATDSVMANKKFEYLIEDTLFDFVSTFYEVTPKLFSGNVINRQEAREIFAFVRENYPELFDDFYRVNYNTLVKEGLYERYGNSR